MTPYKLSPHFQKKSLYVLTVFIQIIIVERKLLCRKKKKINGGREREGQQPVCAYEKMNKKGGKFSL